MKSRVASACTCLFIFVVMGILVKLRCLQPCLFVDIIIRGLRGHCPLGVDKYNPIIEVHFILMIWIIVRLQIFYDLLFEVMFLVQFFLINYHTQTEILQYTIFIWEIFIFLVDSITRYFTKIGGRCVNGELWYAAQMRSCITQIFCSSCRTGSCAAE